MLQLQEQKRNAYLPSQMPGKLLDVGCGSGQRMAHFRGLGWNVVGQDVDESAVGRARKTSGADVYAGPLQAIGFQDETFDAIIIEHVIEHVHHPADLLRECVRILKPNGTMVLVTPNLDSYGHASFGPSWRGLEPPRHLHLFSPTSLAGLADTVSLATSEIWTTPASAEGIFFLSHPLPSRANYLSTAIRYLMGMRFGHRALDAHCRDGRTGEELILRYRRSTSQSSFPGIERPETGINEAAS
jgi:SAM-dependent methyltransferase